MRSFGLRAAFCDFLAAGTGSWARSVDAGPVDAVAAVVTALSGVVCGELAAVVAALSGAERGKLAGDAETCGLSGALVAGEGDEAIVEGAFPAGEGGETIVESVVLRLRGTVAITDLPSPSWPAICTTTPLALAIDPHTSAAEAAASGRD